MKRSVFSTAATLLALGGALIAQQQPTFKSGAKTVAVYATVTKDGRLVSDLTQDMFEVKDGGKVRPISVFSADVQPITVVVMLDRSTSMRGNYGLVLRATEEFINRLGPNDKARIGTFADHIKITPEGFTGDKSALMAALHADQTVTGPTPLWNAVHEAVVALKGQEGRKVVLVFSDGGDSPSNFKLNNHSILDVMQRSQQDDVMVYAIGLQTTVINGPNPRGGFGSMTGGMTSDRPDPGLATIADDTGGGYFELTRADDMSATFASVMDELHRQYTIGFEPAALDGKMHKLELHVAQKGAKVRARKEYYASSDAQKGTDQR